MRIHVRFSKAKQTFKPVFGEVVKISGGGDHPVYEGEYNVTPKIETQTLPTKEKVMADDIKIKAIPFFNVSNTSGGSTVYIGKEV